MELLRAEHAGKTYGTVTALRDVSLVIDQDRPSITAVVGESGSGKTTLARVLPGLVAPTSGRVLYQGQDLRRLGSTARQAFRRDVQAVGLQPVEIFGALSAPAQRWAAAAHHGSASGVVAA